MTAEAGSSGRGAEGGLGRTQSDGGLLSGLGASLTKTPSGVRATHYSDRFIPSRSASNLSYQLLTVPGSGGTPEVAQNAEREVLLPPCPSPVDQSTAVVEKIMSCR
jgi:hypothetical protein